MPLRVVGPYEILSVIGRGGVGTVYRARHGGSGREVAVKVLGAREAEDPVAVWRLSREFQALRRLDHPSIVRVYEAGLHEGQPFLAMELVRGLGLRAYLSPSLDLPAGGGAAAATPAPRFEGWAEEPDSESLVGSIDGRPRPGGAFTATGPADPAPTPPVATRSGAAAAPRAPRPLSAGSLARLNAPPRIARLVDALRQVCDALGHVHAQGLVHRDLKPANIMVDDERRVRLMDFGLVKIPSEHAPLPSSRVVGTYRYMAPEQALGGPIDHRADLYSLGVILFELLCGRPPFAARRLDDARDEVLSRRAPDVLAVNPGAPQALARVSERLLARDPRARFQTAAEVASALAR